MSVASGLEADVVTMNQAPDVDILVERGGYVAADWRKRSRSPTPRLPRKTS